MTAEPKRRSENDPRAWRPGIAAALSLVGACASPGLIREAAETPQPAQPVIASGGALSERRAEAVLAKSAGANSAAERAGFEKLVEGIRTSIGAPLITGNKVTPLIDGPATFAAIDRELAQAKHSIHLETYIYADDELGNKFTDKLIRKRREGVEVRVIYDAVGSFSTPAEFFDRMRAAGIEVAEFRPLNPIKTLPWRHHNRDHRKILIVDGAVAFTGGMNITGAYAAGSASRPGPEAGMTEGWRDTQVEIDGPAALQFQAHFLETWARLGQKLDNKNIYFPPVKQAGDAIVAAVVSNGVRAKDEAIYRTYLAAITHASARIWLTQAYFAPPKDMLDALQAAARRGVDVRVIVPGFSDAGPVFYASRAGYRDLLKSGVRLFEKSDAFLHAKTALVDNAVSIIGSANLDYRSFLHNNEVTAVMIGSDPADYMEKSFLTDVRDTKEITLDEWKKRPATQRFKEWFSSWFKYWL